MKRLIVFFVSIALLPFNLTAQDSRIESSIITIPNSTRSVMNLKVSDRPYSSLKSFITPESVIPVFRLKEKKWQIDSLPEIQLPAVQNIRSNEKDKFAFGEKYTNDVQVGLGNYGHTVFKFKVGNSNNENKFFGFNVNHDANQFGPVKSEYSARSENEVRFESRFLGLVNYWENMVSYKQFTNYFYGLPEIPSYTKIKDLEASYSLISGDGKLSSASKNKSSDYLIKFSGNHLQNSSALSEFVVKSHAMYSYKFSEKLRLKLGGDFIYSNYNPDMNIPKWTRILYRFNPHINYKSSRVSLNAGLLFTTESDDPLLNKNSVFPMLQMDFGASDYIHFFGGVGGDVQFNSFQSFLQQNPWMRIPSQLKNTNQIGHLYAGIKGIGGNKMIEFEAKYDYAEYSDLPFLVNSVLANNKFDVQYRGGLEKIQVTNFSGNLNLNFSKIFSSSFKLNYVLYEQSGIKFQAPHVPTTTLTWTNSWKLSPKILITPDIYWMQSLYALNPVKNQLIQLDDILDVNFKINYFIKRNLNLGLSGNNLLGKNYQRFYQYQVQGLNATISVAYSF